MKTSLGQFIYTSLAYQNSPTKRGGYQVGYYTKSYLTNPDIADLENHMIYNMGRSQPTKLQFFTSKSGQIIVAKTKMTDTKDEKNRKVYFSHGYIIEPSQFYNTFDNNPFWILDNLPFYEQISDVEGLESSGTISDYTTEFHSIIPNINYLPSWTRDKNGLLLLLSLAIQATDFIKQRKMLQIVGDPQEVAAILRTAMAFSHPAIRYSCAFDTHYYDCNLPGAYWAVGLPESIPGDAYILNASTGEFNRSLPNTKEIMPWTWLKFSLHKHDIDQVLSQISEAYSYIDVIRGKRIRPVTSADAEEGQGLRAEISELFGNKIDDQFISVLSLPRNKIPLSLNALQKLEFLIEKITAPTLSVEEFLSSRHIDAGQVDHQQANFAFLKKKGSQKWKILDRIVTFFNRKKRR